MQVTARQIRLLPDYCTKARTTVRNANASGILNNPKFGRGRSELTSRFMMEAVSHADFWPTQPTDPSYIP